MATISIVVPVYKTEKYLRRCVDSILSQTYTDFECVLVDASSPDACPSICDEYAKKDKRVVAIHQKNAGTARARGAGAEASRSAFLVFVDSDDVLPIGALRALHEKQLDSGADVVCGAIKFLFKKREVIYSDVSDFENPLEYAFLSLNNGVCGKIYRREVFCGQWSKGNSDTDIPTSNYGEDLIANVLMLSRIKREQIAFTDSIVYHYDRRTGGITTRMGEHARAPWQEYPPCLCYLWIEEYLKERNLFDGRIKAVFLRRMLKDAILPYITAQRRVSGDEICIFYNDYFAPCTIKNSIRYAERIIIPLYAKSGTLGAIYTRVFNLLKWLRLKALGMY